MATIFIYSFVDFYWKIVFQEIFSKILKKKSLKIQTRLLETDDVENYPKICLWMLGGKIICAM
jgi:hypothetical protein